MGDNDPSWKNELRADFKKLFDGAIAYLQANPNDIYDEKEVKANDLFNEACKYSESNQFETAISTLQKILFLTKDDLLKTDVYNNIGYYYARLKDYQQAISNYRKALTIDPDHAYTNDNLGFALIMTGEPNEGVLCLEKAMQNEQNDPAYTYRNFALYHQHKKAFHLAEQFFQRSFNEGTPVDLLEYYYAEFLLEQGDIENAKAFFLKSAQKNEEEGIARLRQFDRSD
ncbi:tetratricopeptide repeat protein [Chryseolinea serpens]|uniref:tetratricopeptide repeat protein n=1 Tax=Chryseolinea serpens TaxID=947013 RepID=UPI0009FBD5F3|nr:tetratricopeptide repeat protein [Chryseolinea serpens]